MTRIKLIEDLIKEGFRKETLSILTDLQLQKLHSKMVVEAIEIDVPEKQTDDVLKTIGSDSTAARNVKKINVKPEEATKAEVDHAKRDMAEEDCEECEKKKEVKETGWDKKVIAKMHKQVKSSNGKYRAAQTRMSDEWRKVAAEDRDKERREQRKKQQEENKAKRAAKEKAKAEKAKQETKEEFVNESNVDKWVNENKKQVLEKKGKKNWIPKNLKKGRCTPLGNPDCPEGSPQYNLAKTFKKHHGFQEEEMKEGKVCPKCKKVKCECVHETEMKEQYKPCPICKKMKCECKKGVCKKCGKVKCECKKVQKEAAIGLSEKNFLSFAKKKEILGMIQKKLSEQAIPEVKPSETKKDIDNSEFPDFMKYEAIWNSVGDGTKTAPEVKPPITKPRTRPTTKPNPNRPPDPFKPTPKKDPDPKAQHGKE